MDTLAKLNKIDPNAEATLREDILDNVAPNLPPMPLHQLLSKIDPSPVPDELLCGVVINAVLGKLADEQTIKETFEGDASQPSYSRCADEGRRA